MTDAFTAQLEPVISTNAGAGHVVVLSLARLRALAVTQLKRELIDMVRSMAVVEERFPDALARQDQVARDEALRSWESFHAAVDGLPADQREAVHFLWYLGLEQDDAAKLLGITARTLRRRWQDAKTNLRAQLDADDFRSGR
jgi:RNA polymerase sigma factor (sigma-70 family)